MVREMDSCINQLVAGVAQATASSPNEENLRHECENHLKAACEQLNITWTPYQLDRALRSQRGRTIRFTDVAHGAVVIEYEAPGSFRNGRAHSNISHAKEQVEEYVELLSEEEGRLISEYILVIWDGSHIAFGGRAHAGFHWDSLVPFDTAVAERLINALKFDGTPLVHPQLISDLVGPNSDIGSRLMPKFYDAIKKVDSPGSTTTKTKLLFVEWRRLFGQVVGINSDNLKSLLDKHSRAHGVDYAKHPAAYLYALNTYIALVAKIVAAMALPNAAEDIADSRALIDDRISSLEDNSLYSNAGVVNMLSGDFFSWYNNDPDWPSFRVDVERIITQLNGVNFDVSRKTAQSIRDLFKGLYMSFVPRELRHALGEYYTPDWLAAHALDAIGWQPENSLLDPTCGSGTFLLEGLKRRMMVAPQASASELLSGLHGMDLNPLAVLAARASLVVYIGSKIDISTPVRVPVYLADAINPATAVEGTYEHRLQTELGVQEFQMPEALVKHSTFPSLLNRVRELVDADYPVDTVLDAVYSSHPMPDLSEKEAEQFKRTVSTLSDLHGRGWNGIWCSILAERFAAGAMPPADFVVGNPPWVKWSHLPPEYASFIKDRCTALGVFSEDRWVGGIESDISTVITYESLERYCKPGGSLAFFITGTVFANESSQGFRKWRLRDLREDFCVTFVEDYAAVAPFEGVSNHAALLVVRRNSKKTTYPVPYRVWLPPRDGKRVIRDFGNSQEFRSAAHVTNLLASPVPGSDAGPWLKGSRAQHDLWQHLFGNQEASYRARKGVTTDSNGIFFVKVRERAGSDLVHITNDPSMGRRKELPTVSAPVESEHVFPLVRGEGVRSFRVTPDQTYRILVPQRGMHGTPDLPFRSPMTHRFLSRFEKTLRSRSSYKRFQGKQVYWSLWSTGAYTFSNYKVVWREMSGGRFAAAYIGEFNDPILGSKIAIPDHKVYFVPCQTEDEAAYLTGFLNGPIVSEAVSAYAAQLSLGVSVVEYLLIPPFDPGNEAHRELSHLAMSITHAGGATSVVELEKLDDLVSNIMRVPHSVIDALRAQGADERVAMEAAAT